MQTLWWLAPLSQGLLLILVCAQVDVWAEPTVYVMNYPLYYFTTRIAGESAKVVYPIPAQVDPASWQPSAQVIAALQAADLIIVNGASYEKWLQYVTLPQSKIVNSSHSFKDQYIAMTEATTHSHGPGGDHSHTGTAFTTWLDFRFAVQQAQAIAQALARLLPAQHAGLLANYATLARDLVELDQRLDALMTARRTPPLVASHPVYQYLARRYGLQLRSVLWEPDTLPDESQWQELRAILQQHAATWMLWERPPLVASVDKLRALGVNSLVFDPCGNTPLHGDFLSVMRQNVANLQQAFQ